MDSVLNLGGDVVRIVLLATVISKLVEAFVRPLYAHLTILTMHGWTMIYWALAMGIAVGVTANLNLFAPWMPGVIGELLTGGLVGGGASLIWDVLKAQGIARGSNEID